MTREEEIERALHLGEAAGYAQGIEDALEVVIQNGPDSVVEREIRSLLPAPSAPQPGEGEADEVLRLLGANCAIHCRAMTDKAKESEKGAYNRALYIGRASVYAMIGKLLRQPDRLRILRYENGPPPAPSAGPRGGWWQDGECQECGRVFAAVNAIGKDRCPGCGWTDEQQIAFEVRHAPSPAPSAGPEVKP